MGNSVRVPVSLEFQNSVQDFKSIVVEIQNQFSKIKPGTGIYKSLESQIKKAQGLIKNLEIGGKSGVTRTELGKMEKDFSALYAIVSNIGDEFRQIDFKDLNLNSTEFKELNKQLAKTDAQLAKINKQKQDGAKLSLGKVMADDNIKVNFSKDQQARGAIEVYQELQVKAEKAKESVAKLNDELKIAQNTGETKRQSLKSQYDMEAVIASSLRKTSAGEEFKKQIKTEFTKAFEDIKKYDLSTDGVQAALRLLGLDDATIQQVITEGAENASKAAKMIAEQASNKTAFMAQTKGGDYARRAKIGAQARTDLGKEYGALAGLNTRLNTKTSELNELESQVGVLKTSLEKRDLLNLDKEIDAIEKEQNRIRQEIEELARKVTQLNGNAVESAHERGQKGYAATEGNLDATQEAEDFSKQLKSAMSRWMSVGQIVNTVRNGIRQAVQDIKGLDKAMTEIAVVTDMSVSDLWGKINEYMSIAQQYGVTTQGVYEVSQLYYQQGLSTADVTVLTTETLKLARVANMGYAESADAMTVALRAFNMEMSDAALVTDVYSKVAAVTASSQKELADAMSKTASSAASVGSSFENTTAMLAVMVETTRESAQNLGSALKSIISRYGEMKSGLTQDSEGEIIDYNKVDTALRSIGISIKDAQGQFRDFDDVIFELSAAWDGLDKNTQRYIATIMAGNRQQSRFIALVSNYERLSEVSEAAANSEDAGLIQYAKTLDSLDAKLNNIKTSFQQFYMSVFDGEVFKNILDLINNVIKSANRLGPLLGGLNILQLVGQIKNVGMLLVNSLSSGVSKIQKSRNEWQKEFTHGWESVGERIANAIANAIIAKGSEAGRKLTQNVEQGVTGQTAPTNVNPNAAPVGQNLNTISGSFKMLSLQGRLESYGSAVKKVEEILRNPDAYSEATRQWATTVINSADRWKAATNYANNIATQEQIAEQQAILREIATAEQKANIEQNSAKSFGASIKEAANKFKETLSSSKVGSYIKEHSYQIGQAAYTAGTMMSTAGMMTNQDTMQGYDKSTALQAGGAAATTIGQALTGNYIGAVISGVTGIITLIDRWQKREAVKLENAQKSSEEKNVERAEKQERARNLAATIENLKKLQQARYQSEEAEQAFIEAQNKAYETFPALASGFDEAGNAVIDVINDATQAEYLLIAARTEAVVAARDAAAAEFNRAQLAHKQAEDNWNAVQTVNGENDPLTEAGFITYLAEAMYFDEAEVSKVLQSMQVDPDAKNGPTKTLYAWVVEELPYLLNRGLYDSLSSAKGNSTDFNAASELMSALNTAVDTLKVSVKDGKDSREINSYSDLIAEYNQAKYENIATEYQAKAAADAMLQSFVDQSVNTIDAEEKAVWRDSKYAQSLLYKVAKNNLTEFDPVALVDKDGNIDENLASVYQGKIGSQVVQFNEAFEDFTENQIKAFDIIYENFGNYTEEKLNSELTNLGFKDNLLSSIISTWEEEVLPGYIRIAETFVDPDEFISRENFDGTDSDYLQSLIGSIQQIDGGLSNFFKNATLSRLEQYQAFYLSQMERKDSGSLGASDAVYKQLDYANKIINDLYDDNKVTFAEDIITDTLTTDQQNELMSIMTSTEIGTYKWAQTLQAFIKEVTVSALGLENLMEVMYEGIDTAYNTFMDATQENSESVQDLIKKQTEGFTFGDAATYAAKQGKKVSELFEVNKKTGELILREFQGQYDDLVATSTEASESFIGQLLGVSKAWKGFKSETDWSNLESVDSKYKTDWFTTIGANENLNEELLKVAEFAYAKTSGPIHDWIINYIETNMQADADQLWKDYAAYTNDLQLSLNYQKAQASEAKYDQYIQEIENQKTEFEVNRDFFREQLSAAYVEDWNTFYEQLGQYFDFDNNKIKTPSIAEGASFVTEFLDNGKENGAWYQSYVEFAKEQLKQAESFEELFKGLSEIAALKSTSVIQLIDELEIDINSQLEDFAELPVQLLRQLLIGAEKDLQGADASKINGIVSEYRSGLLNSATGLISGKGTWEDAEKWQKIANKEDETKNLLDAAFVQTADGVQLITDQIDNFFKVLAADAELYGQVFNEIATNIEDYYPELNSIFKLTGKINKAVDVQKDILEAAARYSSNTAGAQEFDFMNSGLAGNAENYLAYMGSIDSAQSALQDLATAGEINMSSFIHMFEFMADMGTTGYSYDQAYEAMSYAKDGKISAQVLEGIFGEGFFSTFVEGMRMADEKFRNQQYDYQEQTEKSRDWIAKAKDKDYSGYKDSGLIIRKGDTKLTGEDLVGENEELLAAKIASATDEELARWAETGVIDLVDTESLITESNEALGDIKTNTDTLIEMLAEDDVEANGSGLGGTTGDGSGGSNDSSGDSSGGSDATNNESSPQAIEQQQKEIEATLTQISNNAIDSIQKTAVLEHGKAYLEALQTASITQEAEAWNNANAAYLTYQQSLSEYEAYVASITEGQRIIEVVADTSAFDTALEKILSTSYGPITIPVQVEEAEGSVVQVEPVRGGGGGGSGGKDAAHYLRDNAEVYGNVNGLALAGGNATSKLIAGASMANKTLVGELGPELAVYNGQYHLLGQNGAEFVNLPSDAIVFNHKQTEGIAKGQMGVRGEAMLTGSRNNSKNVWLHEGGNYVTWEELAKLGLGGGSGKGGSKTYDFTNEDLEEWYNLLRQIADLEQEINNIQAERENIKDGHAYLRSLREEQELLEKQVKVQETLLNYRKQELEAQKKDIEKDNILSQIFTFGSNGLLQYKDGNEDDRGRGELDVLSYLNTLSGNEQVAWVQGIGYAKTDQNGKALEGADLVASFFEYVQTAESDYSELYDAVHETEGELENLQTSIEDINDEILENTMEIQEKVYENLVDKLEGAIDDAKESLEEFKEANDNYVNGLEDALQKERDMYAKNQAIADREALQRRLTLLKNSGGSASEIANLEKQLDNTLQDEYFDNQQEAIDSIRESGERQVQLLESQIEIQERQLEFDKEHGVIWNDVYDIMNKTEEEILSFITGSDKSFIEKSVLEQQQMLEDWALKVGMYDEDRAYQNFHAEAMKTYDGDYKDLYATTYANSKLKGMSNEEAAAAAAEAVKAEQSKVVDSEAKGGNAGGGNTETEKKQKTYWKFIDDTGTERLGWRSKEAALGEIGNIAGRLADAANGKYSSRPAELSEELRKISAISATMRASLTSYKSYSTGGLVDYTGLAMVHGSSSKPEAFLNAEQTSLILKGLDMISGEGSFARIVDQFLELTHSLRSLIIEKSSNSSFTVAPGAVVINVEHLDDKYDIDDVANDIMNKMASIAATATNRGVNRR